jgi:DNA-binding NarL/FixJ family response regulator
MSKSTPKASIFIIEDDENLSANMELILTMEGYQVTVAADGADGLVKMNRKYPDMILCDILLPTMDGYEVFERVKNNPFLAKVPFLFISALNQRHQVRQGMVLGADDYLGKPFSREELLTAVAVRLERFALMASAVRHKPIEVTAKQKILLSRITRREREVLILVAAGFTSKEIASTLYISDRTVEIHRANLMKKLEVTNAASLASWAKLIR